jgi:HlyD family secretion protein
MKRKLALPLIAVGMLAFALLHVVRAQQDKPPLPPPNDPARTPYNTTVAGAGLIEAQTENIALGSALSGVVTEVHVEVGQQVAQGARLFRLDDRQWQAELKVRSANLSAAEAQLARLEAMPRPEELPPSLARVRELQAALAEQDDQHSRARKMFQNRAIGEEEMVRRELSARTAREQLARVQADYELLKAGAWKPEKDVAYAQVLQAKAQIEQTLIELERLIVRAPVAGRVLQRNVRPGEYVGTPPGQALIVLGSVDQLHARVDVAEHDIPRFRPGASAKAMLRGAAGQEIALRFVRVEPYVIPKKSLTGDNTERVDTRVLQVIYALEPTTQPVYVGQQVDVFIEAAHTVNPGQ